ncbi:MAG TPA: hypothetical protein VGR28_02160 [Candidatus Thermoplasmatota archaeon]|nr:hypothetical protein [Candidatus Thermoplasmatota archaeon]
MTELLWLQEPGRRTCLARVAGVRGQGFLLDRSIFNPGASAYRHPQPADKGEVWVGGDKRWLRAVRWTQGGALLHVLDGAVPKKGEQVRCHLEVARREAAEDAHTAMHLVLSALARQRKMLLTGPCVVQGGRRFTLAVRPDTFAPPLIAEALATANAAAQQKLEVRIDHAPRDAVHGLDAQPFSDGVTHPGPEGTLRVLRIGEASALPCDGTLRSTTAGLERIVLAATRPSSEGIVLQFRVQG